jgi:hypothetical protein
MMLLDLPNHQFAFWISLSVARVQQRPGIRQHPLLDLLMLQMKQPIALPSTYLQLQHCTNPQISNDCSSQKGLSNSLETMQENTISSETIPIHAKLCLMHPLGQETTFTVWMEQFRSVK